MFSRKSIFAIVALAFVSVSAQASNINFDDQGLTGPPLFSSTSLQTVNLTVDGVAVSISGGTILSNTNFLPGNTTSVYGTADPYLTGAVNPITITFDSPISNFFLDIYNGNTETVDYLVSDNLGNSSAFTLLDNLTGDFQTVGFAATGSIVTILALAAPQGACCAFDFFIDNINFNAPLPPGLNPVPVPAAVWLFGTALIGLIGFGKRRKAA